MSRDWAYFFAGVSSGMCVGIWGCVLVSQLHARIFCWIRQRRSHKALVATRDARIAKVMAQLPGPVSDPLPLAAGGRIVAQEPFRVELPAGVQITPLWRYTLCMLRAADRRRFAAYPQSEGFDA